MSVQPDDEVPVIEWRHGGGFARYLADWLQQAVVEATSAVSKPAVGRIVFTAGHSSRLLDGRLVLKPRRDHLLASRVGPAAPALSAVLAAGALEHLEAEPRGPVVVRQWPHRRRDTGSGRWA